MTILTFKKNGKATILSSCGYEYENMNYNAASELSATNDCTNVPIHCPMCPVSKTGAARTIWRYNGVPHARAEHGGDDSTLSANFEFMHATHVSKEEEARALIDEQTTSRYRAEFGLLQSSDFDIPADAEKEPSAGQVRRRGDTTESDRAARPATKRLASLQQVGNRS